MQSLAPLAADGLLDESQRAKVIEHAKQCAECAESLAFQNGLHDALADGPLRAPPALYFEGVLAGIHRRMPVSPRAARARVWNWRIRPESFATSLAAALICIWIGASVTPMLDFGTGLDFRSSSVAGRESVASAVSAAPQPSFVSVVAIESVGLVAAGSEILSMPGWLREEIGLPTVMVRNNIGTFLRKG